jgi:hypothetical protein
MISQSLPLPDVLSLWDLILAQSPSSPTSNPRLTFLVDVCTSMLLRLRPRLIIAGNRYKGGLWSEEADADSFPPSDATLSDGFVEGLKIIQAYPIEVIGVDSIVQGTRWLAERERREAEGLGRASGSPSYSLSRMSAQLRGMGWGSRRPPETQDPGQSRGPSYLGLGSFNMSTSTARWSKARTSLTAAIGSWSRPISVQPGPQNSIPNNVLNVAAGFSTPPIGLIHPHHQPTLEISTSSNISSPPSHPSRDSNPTSRESSPSVSAQFPQRRSPSQVPTPSPGSRGPRPLILSNRRITRDNLSRQSSISSSGTAPDFRSDTDINASRRIPLRPGRYTMSPSSPSSSVSSLKSPKSAPFPLYGDHKHSRFASSEPRTPEGLAENSSSPRPLSPGNESVPSSQFASDADLSEPSSRPVALERVSRPPRLRAKRSLPALEVTAFDRPQRADQLRKSPLTPRAPLPAESRDDLLARRPSPKPRRVRKTSNRSVLPPSAPDVPYLASEEEGIKADDEEDYSDIFTSYAVDPDEGTSTA